MANIISRVVKGSPLTHQEMDGNFAALNTELGQKAVATGVNATGSWPIAVTGTSSNITGVAAVANGGTGASTVAGARTALNVNNVDNVADASKPVSGPQQAALDLKAPTAGPTFTGSVVVPTLVAGDVSTKATNAAFVAAAIVQAKADLVAGAPVGLDSFSDVATALGNDPAFATTTAASLNNRLRIDVASQGLSPAQKLNGVTNLGLAPSATTDTTNATNIATGTLGAARLPALSGDITAVAGTGVTVLAASGVVANAYGSATLAPVITFDAKGRAVSASTALITPAFSNITGKPTTIAGYGITDDLKLTSAPGAALGISAVGVSVTAARADHVHALPAIDVLSNVTIASKVSGDTLVWNGVAWVNTAQSSVTSGNATKLATPRNIALSGDATGTVAFDGSANVSIATVLANTAVAAGSYGSATQAAVVTFDAKGRATAASAVTITPAFASITGKPTTVAGYGITDALALSATAGAALGTAAAGVATTAARSDHAHAMPAVDALSNVTIAAKASGDILVWNGAAWINSPQAAATSGAATKLATARTISLTGDATGSVLFDGTANAPIAMTLANSGVGAAVYGSATQVPVLTVDTKGRVTTASSVVVTPAFANITGKPTTLGGYGITDAQPALGYTPVNQTALGVANGVATLDGAGKLSSAQIPSALIGALVYQGTWNAATNTPVLANGVGTKGHYYKASVAGTSLLDGQAYWEAGDLVIFNGTTWDRVEGGTTEVSTVAGRVGDVVLSASDISGLAASATVNTQNAANITSGTLLAARMPAYTGDVTSVAGATALTLVASGVAAGNYGSATEVADITVDAKGRVTAVTAVTVTPAFNSITGKPTTAAGYGITDALTTGALVTVAQGGTGVSTSTGSNANVLQNSPTLTGTVLATNLTASGSLTGGSLSITAAAGAYRTLWWNSAAAGRFNLHVDNVAESGADAGSNMNLVAISDGGVQAVVYSVARATKVVDFKFGPTLNGAALITASGAPVQSVAGRTGAVVLAATDIGSGTLLAARMPAYTGDVTSAVGTVALSLAASGVVAGSYGTAGVIPVITVDAKGRVTNVGTANVSIPFSSLTAKPTTLAGYGITDGATTAGMVALANCMSNINPTGAVDGVNATYVLPQVPVAMLQVFVNGLLQEPGAGNDFTISGATITMLTVIPSGGKIRAFYIK